MDQSDRYTGNYRSTNIYIYTSADAAFIYIWRRTNTLRSYNEKKKKLNDK